MIFCGVKQKKIFVEELMKEKLEKARKNGKIEEKNIID